ncbi:type I-MYXAN CRISPR-associated protein Cas6/Cmx6 [Capilliphycus salinus ALCB114379]|uniref:type I-MYXAN CRISPR-associated protein Cas6/Cmx6 n=1 Tax=Capilliphycus salinus TaxID=2768948 RepID=UPI0039A64A80
MGYLKGEIRLPRKKGKPVDNVVHITKNSPVSIKGFAVQVVGLSDSDSLLLQQLGLGAKKKWGCGWFE